MRAMAKVPADRFASIQRFLDALASPGYPVGGHDRAAATRRRPRPRPSRRLMIGLAGGVLVAAAAWWLVAGRRAPGRHTQRSARSAAVAVLPFQEVAGGPDSSYLGEGMTEGLIADLAEIGSLKVISRSSGAAAQGAMTIAGRAGE